MQRRDKDRDYQHTKVEGTDEYKTFSALTKNKLFESWYSSTRHTSFLLKLLRK